MRILAVPVTIGSPQLHLLCRCLACWSKPFLHAKRLRWEASDWSRTNNDRDGGGPNLADELESGSGRVENLLLVLHLVSSNGGEDGAVTLPLCLDDAPTEGGKLIECV